MKSDDKEQEEEERGGAECTQVNTPRRAIYWASEVEVLSFAYVYCHWSYQYLSVMSQKQSDSS